MRFRCSCCGATLSKFCPKVGCDGDFTGGPWYVDENQLNHSAFICLHCGTIHDAVGSITKTLWFTFSFGNSMQMKIVGTMNPLELGMILMRDERFGVESARDIVARELALKPRWVDVMLDRKVLGHAFEEGR